MAQRGTTRSASTERAPQMNRSQPPAFTLHACADKSRDSSNLNSSYGLFPPAQLNRPFLQKQRRLDRELETESHLIIQGGAETRRPPWSLYINTHSYARAITRLRSGEQTSKGSSIVGTCTEIVQKAADECADRSQQSSYRRESATAGRPIPIIAALIGFWRRRKRTPTARYRDGRALRTHDCTAAHRDSVTYSTASRESEACGYSGCNCWEGIVGRSAPMPQLYGSPSNILDSCINTLHRCQQSKDIASSPCFSTCLAPV
ncbi:hypothetical protein IE81DRAFT_200205 [Ceraceosorus guamensis]|uniref:Uncharacterized protein n=1 Tax=Ceraceosorus guamensis TaxID=1522189 RepID=A0A316VU44_9BASI|nr:hypothetical protein IE81DRAFT_200205 [Ceraceosorus guamensis]PWN40940.1 hypothetical protein IE81DRAFT_200205 [Ceraceosorus guamensis]